MDDELVAIEPKDRNKFDRGKPPVRPRAEHETPAASNLEWAWPDVEWMARSDWDDPNGWLR
jgi:hypothetical protein